MKTSVELQNSLNVRLSETLLVYREERRDRCYVTRHEVLAPSTVNGQPVLGPAKPLTSAFLAKLNTSLGKGIDLEILPENVLVRTLDTIVWWTPAQHRVMFFTGDRAAEFAALNGKSYPQPPLLFMAKDGRLLVRALTQDTRPDSDTALSVAPYWNVYANGDICLGSMARPETRTVRSIKAWETSFFASKFTHPNTPQITSFPSGYLDLCTSLAGQTSAYPREYLIDAKQTLGQFIQRSK
jgi:PRTRC genetic system protein B